jgi:phosphomannomutase
VSDSPVQIKFGTDGWRAVIAREFTFVNVERVAQAYADFVTREAGAGQKPFVVIGYDRRFLSEKFAARTAEVMAGNGFEIALFADAQPTPLISWAVKDLKAAGGVMITASHNPANFNGFKIKAPWGGSAAPETTREVEKLVDAQPPKRATVSDDGHKLL